MMSKAERHGIRVWVRQRKLITKLDMVKVSKHARRDVVREMRKRRFAYEDCRAVWVRA